MGVQQANNNTQAILSKGLFSTRLTFKMLLLLQDKAEMLPLLDTFPNDFIVKSTHLLIYSIVTALPTF